MSFLIVLSQLLNFAGGSYGRLSAGCFTTSPALLKSFVFITLIDKQPELQEAELERGRSIFCWSADLRRCSVMDDLKSSVLQRPSDPAGQPV